MIAIWKYTNWRKVFYLQHLSQKNLSSAFNVSVELKFFRQLVIELFCSISRLRSKNVSSLAVTVSHLKHLVSFVSIPYKKNKFSYVHHDKKEKEKIKVFSCQTTTTISK